MACQIPWDRYEVALLLDAYLRIQEEPQKEKEILADLSKNLRKRAIHLGYTIDALFRNENGMSLQYQRMKILMTNSAHGFDGPISRCFHEVVDIYKKDRDWYQMILNKARKEAGLEAQEKKKKAPIIVVDGVRVDAGASDKNVEPAKKPPPVSVLKHEPVIREVPTSTNSSELSIIDRLHLAPALQRKLEEEGIHTIKALQHFLADHKENYMIDFKDWQDANDKLQAYLKEASSCSSASALIEKSPFEQKKAEPDESTTRSMRLLSEEDFSRIPPYAQKWSIYCLDLPFELNGRLYTVSVHTVKELYDYFAVHTINDVFSQDDWALLHLKLLAYRKRFVKEQRPVVKAQPKTEEKKVEPLVTAEPSQAYGRMAEEPASSEEDKLAQVLREKFPDGLRQQNLAMKQYKARYEEMFGEALLVQNAMLMEKLRDIGEVRVDGRIYAKASGAEQGILEGIAKDLMRLLDESASSLYWPCIYEHYRNEFSGLSIFTEDVMRSELMPLFSSDYVCGEVISKRSETQDRGEEIRRLVTESPVAISLTSIQEKIWYWPQNMVKKFLDGVPGIIKAKDLYFYGPNVTLSDTEKQRLRDALLEDIAQKQFITNVRLREILEESCPGVAMDMSSLDDALLRKVLAMLYPADFIERAKGLFPAGHMKSGREQIQEYCHAHTKLSTSDIKWFAKQRGILGNICNYVMDEMVRVSPEEWIRRDHVHFRGKEAHIIQKIGQQMGKKAYMPLEDFTLFLSFPDIGIPWNVYVLESFLYKNDAMLCPFSLVQANGWISDSGVYGAVVKKGYAIDSYDDVLIELLSHSPDWQTDEEALDLIVAHKLQVLRKIKQIGTIVKQAKRKRAQLVTANR